jgi:peptide/nickel transport system substrate-binding protein
MTVGRHSRHPLWVRLAIVTAAGCGTMAVVGACRTKDGAEPQAPAALLRVGVGQLSATNPVDGLRQLTQNVSVEALVRPGEDGRLQPWLAESWTTAPNGRSLRVRIRSGVKFHDGSAFDAQALATLLPNALRVFMGPAIFANVGVEVSGPQTVDIGFQHPVPFLMEALEAQIRKPGASVTGTGPYMVAADSTSELRANKDYYLGPPTIDRIAIQSYPSVRAAWADMLRDRIDMLYDVGLDALDSMETATNVSVFTFTRKYQYMIALNDQSAPLRSRKIRQALNLAIDPATVVRNALNGHGLVSKGPFWMRHWALRADLPSFEYDPQRAAAMVLAEGGPGKRGGANVQFTLLVPPDAVHERIALEVKRQLEPVGVVVVVEQVSLDRLSQAIQNRTFDAVLTEGISGPTLFRPYQLWHSGGTFNAGGLGNASVDAAFDGLRGAASEDEFRTAAARVQQAFMDDPPVIFLAWTERARAVSKRFNVATDPGRPDVLGTMRLWKPVAAEGQTSPH